MSRRAVVFVLFALVLGFVAAASAQRGETSRTIKGQVVGPEGKPAVGALVHLKNLKTGTVLTVTTDEDGSYEFVGLPQKVDFELHVEFKDLRSTVKKVSGFDRRARVILNFDFREQKKRAEPEAKEKPAS